MLDSLIESTKLNIEKVVYPKRHSPRRIGKFIKSAIRFTSYMRSGLEEEVVEEEEVEEEEVEEVVVEAEKVVEEEIEKSTSRMQRMSLIERKNVLDLVNVPVQGSILQGDPLVHT